MESSKNNNGLNGEVKIPGDKSISHRSIIIPSISKGISEISNILKSEDVLNTLSAFKLMGVKIEEINNKIIIHGNGISSLRKPKKKIYLGNSGTSARLLIGLLAAQNFSSIIEGDASLSSRPMARINDPLIVAGANIKSNNGTMPINIVGQKLKPIKYVIPLPSAQVKSGLILAALNIKGESIITEKNITRDHTEIMLESFGANIKIKREKNLKHIFINGNHELSSNNINVPSDLSSSAFFIVAALINKNSFLILKNVNINPSRDGILRVLKMMGGNISILNKRMVNREIVADIEVKSSKLNGCKLDAEIAKLMIDEYPILAIAASFASSPSNFKGLKELRVKESDRLELIRLNLVNCGVDAVVNENNLFIKPSKNYLVKNSEIKTDYDHRIAMSFCIMGGLLDQNLKILDYQCIKTSFPNFFDSYNNIGGNLIE